MWSESVLHVLSIVRSHLGLQMTQPTRGGAVTAITNCGANCVETSRPQQWRPDLQKPFVYNMTNIFQLFAQIIDSASSIVILQ